MEANVGIQMTYLIDGNAFREFYKSNDVGLVYTNEFNHWMNTYDPSEAKRIPMGDSEILIGRIWEEGHGKFRGRLTRVVCLRKLTRWHTTKANGP